MLHSRWLEAPVLLICLLAAACGGGGSAASSPSAPSPGASAEAAVKPNIIFVVTDDLDNGSLPSLPRLKALLSDQGASFANNYATNPLCCPSRASMLTGEYPHNHGIVSNGRTLSCFEEFRDAGGERSTVATALKAAGYHTGIVGKYLNRYPGLDPASPEDYVAPGWDEWYVPFDASRQSDTYYDYSMNQNGHVVTYGHQDGDYLTNVLNDLAVQFIQRNGAQTGTPFFLWLATSAPHTPATPSSYWIYNEADKRAPRPPSFNEADISDKPLWYQQNLELLTDDDVRGVDVLFERRLETMHSVEDGLDKIVQALQAVGQLDNTYIILTSDNGFMLGVHRFPQGKDAPYEESIKVPLIVRGPHVPAGRILDQLALNIDLAPTFLELAGVQPPASMDGRSLVPLFGSSPPSPDAWRKDFLAEHQDYSASGGLPTWFLLHDAGSVYVDYPTQGEHEYYDLVNDPYQLDSRDRGLDAALRSRLVARLNALEVCRGASCRSNP